MLRKRRGRGKKPDPLSVQVSFRLKLPKDKHISKRALSHFYSEWVLTGKLPKWMEIHGIFWRNPARHGAYADWRYSDGSDLSALRDEGAGVESFPRGSHDDARVTLQAALPAANPFA